MAASHHAAGNHMMSRQPQLVQQQATPTALQLQSFLSTAQDGASLLGALAASTRLTQLVLPVSSGSVTPSWSESLGRLTSLRTLDLIVARPGDGTQAVFPEGC
jgi:hypothetical protein